MKYVISIGFEGFFIPEEVRKAWHYSSRYDYSEGGRTDPILIEWVENHTDETDLRVVEIPDTATDFEIDECDGMESITAVVNGRIIHIYG